MNKKQHFGIFSGMKNLVRDNFVRYDNIYSDICGMNFSHVVFVA